MTYTSVARVTLADGARIDCDGLPLRIVNRLRNLAAFRNPEYVKRLRMHLSVRDTPRVVDLSSLDGGELVLPRGCADSALSVLRDAGAEPFVADGRTEGRRIHVRFCGKLRGTQQKSLAPFDIFETILQYGGSIRQMEAKATIPGFIPDDWSHHGVR